MRGGRDAGEGRKCKGMVVKRGGEEVVLEEGRRKAWVGGDDREGRVGSLPSKRGETVRDRTEHTSSCCTVATQL